MTDPSSAFSIGDSVCSYTYVGNHICFLAVRHSGKDEFRDLGNGWIVPANKSAKGNGLYGDGHVSSSSYAELRAIPKPADAYVVNADGANRGSSDIWFLSTGYDNRAGAPQNF